MKFQKTKIDGKKPTNSSAVQKRLQVRSSASTIGYLNSHWFHKILKKVKDPNILLFLKVLYDTSLRISDLISIKSSDLDLSRRVIILKSKKELGQSRLVRLNIKDVKLLKKCINNNSTRVFSNLTIKAINEEFQQALELSGIPPFPLHRIRNVALGSRLLMQSKLRPRKKLK
jgi:integrase